MKNIAFYMKQRYTIELKNYLDNQYCAEIKEIPGLCAYGETELEALEELEIVKQTAFEIMLEQKKTIPLPSITFEIPREVYEKFTFREELEKFAIL